MSIRLFPRSILFVSLVAAACSDGPSTAPATPTAPSVTPGAIALAVSPGSDLLLLGASETYVATAGYSDGTSRVVSATWSTDNGGIVSIDGGGRATAVGPGVTTITARAEGRTASLSVRALPDFAGNWRLQVRTTVCDVPPRWGAGFCNVSGLVTMTLRLSRSDRDGIVGSVDNGIGWTGTVSGNVSIDGTLSLTGRLTSVRSRATFHSDYSEWRTRLSPADGMTGSFREISDVGGRTRPGHRRQRCCARQQVRVASAPAAQGGLT